MTPWLWGCLVLVGVPFPVALWVGARGSPVDRLVGLELAGVTTTLALLAFAHAVGQSSYLILPLVTALLSFAGSLVFTRLLAPRS
ncbi:MrpF/PhaF family protein [Nocardioides terrisoli]|uniref:MrpF/PhaF family protein n=1 Tax=Nocardioides terrisoli TaxID=3388267 RepID=UPI00287B954F|nr:MrpF/PhaF family protein [Nocardioides marmorisolisilvae]